MNSSESLPTTWRPVHVTQLVPGHVANISVDNTTLASPMVAVHWGPLALGLLVLATAVGNVLLILAVALEHSLQNMTNFFLASLAVADLLVAVVVMPLAVVVQLYDGYFPLGSTLCIVWATMDVLMCTASIWHMATISVDRYCSLRFPLRYRRTKTKLFVIAKIAGVWVVSVGICSPLAIAGFVNPRNVYRDGQCAPAVPEFVIYGSIFAFYVPLVVMFLSYALTVRALSANTGSLAGLWRRQMSAKKRQPMLVREMHVHSSTTLDDQRHHRHDPGLSGSSSSSSDSDPPIRQVQTPPPSPGTHQSELAWNGGSPAADSRLPLPRLMLALHSVAANQRRRFISTPDLATSADDDVGRRPRCDSDVFPVASQKPTSGGTGRFASLPTHTPTAAAAAAARLRCRGRFRQSATLPVVAVGDAFNRVFRRRTATMTSTTDAPPPSPTCQRAPTASTPRTPGTAQSGSGSTKRKATRVLGVMFVVFVVFWTPFFVLNVLSAACPACVESLSPSVGTVLVWLGWTSSLANPIIYTSFSPAFRAAFCRLLTCRSRRSVSMARRRQQQWTNLLRRARSDTDMR